MKKRTVVFLTMWLLISVTMVMAEEGKIYVVQKGDTFSQICQEQMESGSETVYAREAKRLSLNDPYTIYPGQIFHFPYVYRITWESRTGVRNSGEWCLNMSAMIAQVNHGNQKYSHIIIHKLERK